MRRLLPVLAVLLALGALAACGGGPSKSSFLAEADDTCRSADAPVTSLKTPSSFPELADGAKAVVAATDAQVPRLRDLDRPGGDKDDIDAVFNAIAGAGAAARSLQEAAERKDERATAQAANDLTARARQAGDGARAYGFGTCGVSTQAAAGTVADGAKAVVKASFVLKAETSCKEATRKAEALSEPNRAAQAARFLNAVIAIYGKVIDDLKALVPPPGDEPVVAEIVDTQQKTFDKVKELKDAVSDENERLAEARANELNVLGTAANAKADAYGIKACGTLSDV